MKTHTTKRSISVVTFFGLLTSLIAVALVRYAAAEGEVSLAPSAGGDAVTVWNGTAGVAATEKDGVLAEDSRRVAWWSTGSQLERCDDSAFGGANHAVRDHANR